MDLANDIEVQPLVAQEYRALAEFLDQADEAVWDLPSLCEGWRVREVVAHVTMPVRYSPEQFMKELERCGFDFTRLSNEVAARDAELPTEELNRQLNSDELHHWAPPQGGYRGALNHAVVHGLDVTVAVGVPRLAPDETIRIVLDDLTAGGGHAHFGTQLEGRRLVATDLDWTYGSGDELQGTAGDLVAVLCGREVEPGRLAGRPLARADN